MKRNLDHLLKQALSPSEEPKAQLNRKILVQAEEMANMKKKRKKRVSVAVLAAAATLAAGSIAVVAAARYLTPGQMAERSEDLKLAEAFESEDAVLVNEAQEYAGFRVTLLGAVSGKNISKYLAEDQQGQLKDDRFYAAVAIEHADGTPMPDTSDDAYGEESFYVSPYIKGLEPWNYGIMNMGGGYSEFVQDGIQYRMLDMENISIFADRGLYIGVSSGTFYDAEAYVFSQETGEITRNEAYEKVNALFTLPLDPAKGDPEAAEAFLASMEKENTSSETPEMDEQALEVEAWVEEFRNELAEGRIKEDAERIESTVQTCTPKKEGGKEVASYAYDLGDHGGGSGIIFLDDVFPERNPGTSAVNGYHFSDNELDGLKIEVITLNEDGTVTFAVYQPKL
ncbi:MAG: hypothetical protein HFI14_02745 [Lachnospiraceae bacterium]|nr:hypothetical protein [Lachnospiraceae bacterium]